MGSARYYRKNSSFPAVNFLLAVNHRWCGLNVPIRPIRGWVGFPEGMAGYPEGITERRTGEFVQMMQVDNGAIQRLC